jgi:hypothetical protein
MKTLQKISLLFALVTMLASCQTGADVNKILSDQDTKMKIMNTIANDSMLSTEMIEAMINNENGNRMMMHNGNRNTMMMQNQEAMLKMMQNNPAMMQSMVTGMMETFKNDTLMMSSMSSIMLKNPQMKDQIYKNMDGNMGMKSMYNRNGSNYKTK